MNDMARIDARVRRFGLSGPIYEIVGPAPAKPGFVRIRVVESGEELDYPRDEMLKDPLEA